MNHIEKAQQIARIVIDAYDEAGINTDGVNIETMIYFMGLVFGKEAQDAVKKALCECVVEGIKASA